MRVSELISKGLFHHLAKGMSLLCYSLLENTAQISLPENQHSLTLDLPLNCNLMPRKWCHTDNFCLMSIYDFQKRTKKNAYYSPKVCRFKL